MKKIKNIVVYLGNYKLETGLIIVFNLLANIFTVVSPPMLVPFLQILFDQTTKVRTRPVFALNEKYFINMFYYQMQSIVKEHSAIHALVFLVCVIVLVFFLKNIFRYAGSFYMAKVRNGVVHDIQNQLYTKITDLPLSFFSGERKGDLISKMTSDVKEVEYGILGFLDILFKDPILIILTLFTLFMISSKLCFFVFFMMGIIAAIIFLIGKTLKRQSQEGQQHIGMIISVIDETIGGIRIIRAFNTIRFMRDKFFRMNKAYETTMNRVIRRRDLSSPLTEVMIIAVMCVILWYGGKMVLVTHEMNNAVFISFVVIFFLLIEPSKRISNAWYNIQKGLVSFDRIKVILDAENNIKEKDNASALSAFTHSIEYRAVSFAYNNRDDKEVLRNINIQIEKGKMIALVGQSGSGKTTLADLLCRFYDVTAGQIIIDGIDIRDYKLLDLRNQMGIVSQEPILFNDSIFNNIAFGLENATQEMVEQAAKVANVHEFIEKLPQKYQTMLSDRGQNLSGGERQRITIARAVLRNPAILILDEATSSLDSESEKLVQDALTKLMKNRTSIVIAHRLSTIQYADEILVMQDGEIVERGNHIGLLAKEGLYNKLVALQAF
jgi:subfamily B ATP-binding cassette protein MsbA